MTSFGIFEARIRLTQLVAELGDELGDEPGQPPHPQWPAPAAGPAGGVEHDQPMALAKPLCERPPRPYSCAEAVDEHQGRPLTGPSEAHSQARGSDELGAGGAHGAGTILLACRPCS